MKFISLPASTCLLSVQNALARLTSFFSENKKIKTFLFFADLNGLFLKLKKQISVSWYNFFLIEVFLFFFFLSFSKSNLFLDTQLSLQNIKKVNSKKIFSGYMHIKLLKMRTVNLNNFLWSICERKPDKFSDMICTQNDWFLSPMGLAELYFISFFSSALQIADNWFNIRLQICSKSLVVQI